jgi:two-component system KDP operon response regulator KdpE
MTNNSETILIVDDENQIRRLLEITLSASGYKIIEAASGREGVQMAASHRPSAIILDLGLPDMDGMDVLRSLKEWYGNPVIILSARNSEEDIVNALDEGANDYISKPFRTGELLARIRATLRLNQSTGDNPVFQIEDLYIDTLPTISQKRETTR